MRKEVEVLEHKTELGACLLERGLVRIDRTTVRPGLRHDDVLVSQIAPLESLEQRRAAKQRRLATAR